MSRLLTAAAALGLGIAFSYAMYRWQTPYLNPSPNQTRAWLFPGIPFAGLAVLIALGLRRSASLVGWIVLAALTALAFAAGRYMWFGVSGNAGVFFGVYYATIVVVHLIGQLGSETHARLPANPTTARRLGIALGVFTVLAAAPLAAPWTSETGSALTFPISFGAPLWLSTAFAFRQLALGRARRRSAAYLWFAAALFGLFLLFIGALLSHVQFGD